MAVEDESVPIVIKTHSRAKRMTLRILDGEVRITKPRFVTDKQALKFLNEKREWVNEQLLSDVELRENETIAHRYTLKFALGNNIYRNKLDDSTMTVFMPSGEQSSSHRTQNYTKQQIEKVLLTESKRLIGGILKDKTEEYGFEYSELRFRKMRSRWGSCSSKKVLTFNIHLVNAPYEIIEHVVLHELAHTLHMNHSADFWKLLRKIDPECDKNKKILKTFDARSLYVS